MKKLNWPRLSALIGIVFVVIGVSVALLWNSYGREMFYYKDCITVRDDVKKGDVIKPDMLVKIKIEENMLINNVMLYNEDNIKLLVNKIAKQYIPKNSQLCSNFFEDAGVSLAKEQRIMKVPNEWILAVPSSIRRGDMAFFYEFDNVKAKEAAASGMDVSVSISSTEVENEEISESLNNIDAAPVLVDSLDVDKLITKPDGSFKLPIVAAKVAYVKDSANREVITLSDKDRYDGSSQVSSLEIIVDLKQLALLEKSIAEQKIFLILYQDVE